MPQITRAPQQCTECPQIFTPDRKGPFKRCPDCGPKFAAAYRAAWKRENAPRNRTPTTRPCRNCGGPVHRSGRVYAWYCSDPCKPRCTVDPCGQPARKMGWCAGHYSQYQRIGEVKPFSYKWAEAGIDCVVCSKPTGQSDDGSRRYCSSACKAYWHFHGGQLPGPAACAHCGKVILEKSKSGRQRRADVKMCSRCKTGLRKHGLSVDQLATRDGAFCQLCDLPVDLTLRAPNPGCPSVDHHIPRARGGTNDPKNLRLAHLICNVIKGDSLPM